MSAAEAVGKCSKIRRIVRLRQMLLRWRRKARVSAASRVPRDVPLGHVAVCVGDSRTRFVVRAAHLNHPAFQSLLVQAEEEYGFTNCGGPLTIPCDEALFEEVLHLVGSGRSVRPMDNVEDLQRSCHVGGKTKGLGIDLWIESRPLLNAPVSKSTW